MAHKNDYTVIAFLESGKPLKWIYVHTLSSIAKHLDKVYPTWKYFNVYNRRSGAYLRRFYKGSNIPPFLSLGVILGVFLSHLAALAPLPLNSTFNKSGEAFNPYPKPLIQFLTPFREAFPASGTFTHGFNNTATIWTISKQKGGFL